MTSNSQRAKTTSKKVMTPDVDGSVPHMQSFVEGGLGKTGRPSHSRNARIDSLGDMARPKLGLGIAHNHAPE